MTKRKKDETVEAYIERLCRSVFRKTKSRTFYGKELPRNYKLFRLLATACGTALIEKIAEPQEQRQKTKKNAG